MKKIFRSILFLWPFLLAFPAATDVFAGNPLRPDFGMADPHAYVFEDKVYLFTTRDADKEAKNFVMPDWHIWSTTDLVHWTHERTIVPEETYMGHSTRCWATETVFKNGKYYFYFSNGNTDTGVMVAERPQGPYKDALGRPMLDSSLTPGKEYDPTAFVCDDGKAYIMFGHYRESDKNLRYHMAQLSDDMISLQEKPRVVEIYGKMNVFTGNDKPNLHFHNGLYYLSGGSIYAVSENIYGPYLRTGNSGNGNYGLNARAHGNYFHWHNQWFHVWCHFHLGKENGRFRESYMTYLHYRKNGEMVTDTVLLDRHFENGVGQYSAAWDRIETEWFMAASREDIKQEREDGGFGLAGMQDGDYVCYPNVRDMKEVKTLAFIGRATGSGTIEIHEDTPDGRLMGTCPVNPGQEGHLEAAIRPIAEVQNLCLVFRGCRNFCELDAITFK